ncbi:MAG: hypothetical protein AVDCRST_MAG26-4620, partial [uncultured Chloroflexia bacterium]
CAGAYRGRFLTSNRVRSDWWTPAVRPGAASRTLIGRREPPG